MPRLCPVRKKKKDGTLVISACQVGLPLRTMEEANLAIGDYVEYVAVRDGSIIIRRCAPPEFEHKPRMTNAEAKERRRLDQQAAWMRRRRAKLRAAERAAKEAALCKQSDT